MVSTMRDNGEKKELIWGVGFFLLIITIVCLIVAIIVVVGDKNSVDDVEKEIERVTQFNGWEDYIANKDMEGLIEFTNKEIEATDEAEVKAIIYASRAGVLYSFDAENENDEYKAQILSDVYSAEEYYPTGDTAYLIYMYEQAYGNTVVAEDYLKIAEERGKKIPLGEG